MKRSLFGAIAAITLLATPAIAQDASFEYLGGSDLSRTGRFLADYPGGDVLTPPALGTTFGIFCIDPSNAAPAPGTIYDVWVTAIAQANSMGQTRLGQDGVGNAYDRYWRAAFLAEHYLTNAAPNDQAVYQYAIWGVITGAPVPPTWYFGSAIALIDLANAQAVDAAGFGDWAVITDVSRPGAQEFLYRNTGGGLEIVPEPATMTLLATGLAGMAAANRRRRKQK